MTTILVAKQLRNFLMLFLDVTSVYSMKTTLVGKEFRKFLMLFLDLSSVYSLEEIMYFNWLLDIDRMSPLIEINMTARKRGPTCLLVLYNY